ncbi:MAG TPA: ROK family protein [Terriglobales bacterium]|nr:ROK family protein [Terriglobales bacterium]
MSIASTNKLVTDQPAGAEPLFVGVDIGGTKVAAGLVDPKGQIRWQCSIPMISDRDGESGLAVVRSAIDAALTNAAEHLAGSSVMGIGICSPGPLDPKSGTIINPPNLPCWRNFQLVAEIARSYRVPVKLDNDGNAAALAEALWGAGRGYRNVFCTTIGTGIGTGIVFDGQVYHGRTGAAAEGGHMSIDRTGPRCGCGKPGCIEALASGPAIASRARAKLNQADGNSSALLKLCEGHRDRITSEMVGRAYEQGDSVVKQVLLETADALSLWLGNIIDLLEPDVIVIGGGVAAMLRPFLPEVKKRLSAYCVNSRCQEIPMLPAHYGADAGIVGGAALCFTSASVNR